MTDSPEIKRLREQASSDGIYPTRWVTLAHAIQAVRDTDERVRDEMALTRLSYDHARREAFREAVEALRELAETESGEAATALRGAALLLAARLSPDNPEGNA